MSVVDLEIKPNVVSFIKYSIIHNYYYYYQMKGVHQ